MKTCFFFVCYTAHTYIIFIIYTAQFTANVYVVVWCFFLLLKCHHGTCIDSIQISVHSTRTNVLCILEIISKSYWTNVAFFFYPSKLPLESMIHAYIHTQNDTQQGAQTATKNLLKRKKNEKLLWVKFHELCPFI